MHVYHTLTHLRSLGEMEPVYNTPWEAFTAALFLTNSLEVAKFLHRQNQSVQVNAFYVCVRLPFLFAIKANSARENFVKL